MSKTEQIVSPAGAMLLYGASKNMRLVSPECDVIESFVSVTLITVQSSPTR
jgi:hypothetical protein